MHRGLIIMLYLNRVKLVSLGTVNIRHIQLMYLSVLLSCHLAAVHSKFLQRFAQMNLKQFLVQTCGTVYIASQTLLLCVGHHLEVVFEMPATNCTAEI